MAMAMMMMTRKLAAVRLTNRKASLYADEAVEATDIEGLRKWWRMPWRK